MNTVLIADDTPREALPPQIRQGALFLAPVASSFVLPALLAKGFPALLTFLLSFALEIRRRRGGPLHYRSHLGLNTEDTVTSMHRDGDAFLLGSFHNLVFPADIVALLFARELDRLAIAQESDDRFPINIDIFVLNR